MDVKGTYFSIITPTYNRGYIIGEMIESLLMQNFNSWELIIVDDGSTDNTKDVVERYSKKNQNILYSQLKRNLGVNVARNFGSKKATGEWLIFMDSDDKFAENALDSIYQYTQTVKSVLFFFACRGFNGEILSNRPNYEGFISFKDLLCGNLKGEYLPVIKRSVFLDFLFPEDIRGAPGFTWLLVAKTHHRIYVSKKVARLYNSNLNDRLSIKRKNLDRLAKVWKKHLFCFWKDYLRYCPLNFTSVVGKFLIYAFLAKLVKNDQV